MKFSSRTAVLSVSLVALLAAVWIFGSAYLGRPLNSFRGSAYKLLTQPYFHIGNLPITSLFFVQAVLYVILLIIAARTGRRFLKNRVLARTSIDPGLQYAFQVGFGYFIFIIGLVIGLQSVGLNLSSLAFISGALGVGIGFGLQNIVNNFVSGLILLVERPIKVGDRVDLGELTGDVVRIAARSTWVRTNDNVVIIVPNSDFISSQVTNWTVNDRRVRIRLPLGVSYSSDPEVVRKILLDITAARQEVLQEPAPDVIFIGFGDSSLDFELRVWTTDSLRTPLILKSDLYFAIFKAFRENDIEIPFPQRDLHLRSVSGPLPLLSAAESKPAAPGPGSPLA